MKIQNKYWVLFTFQMLYAFSSMAQSQSFIKDAHRPQIHFSPKAHWMNDPNGMVYYKGVYHLFYQYHPGSSVWGPMHWGHATSKDLIHWQEQQIGLYPDSLGYIFSGGAVVDKNNTSGFGKNGQPPLVAVFTHHDPKGEKAGRNDFQTQSIAYSLDGGKTWTKYAGNPVLKNPGIVDFRDPKVSWYEDKKKWIMTLATKDRITFYGSKNLKTWTKESEFGANHGAHGGVWECPDLFAMDYNGKKVWVLLVNINPGGPNKGSATQYFTGTFDGTTFTPNSKQTKWLDYGPDEYAGITWSNTGNRKLFIGWMSNWQYATVVPTERWRSATTVARELSLSKIGDEFLVASKPVKELNAIALNPVVKSKVAAQSFKMDTATGAALVHLTLDKSNGFSFELSNELGEKVTGGFDAQENQFHLDRSLSGKIDFEKGFGQKHVAPRFATLSTMDVTLVIDKASVELFADNGLSVMTQIFFPNQPYNQIKLQAGKGKVFDRLQFSKLKSIWSK